MPLTHRNLVSSIGRHTENPPMETKFTNREIRQHLPDLSAYRKGSHRPHYASIPRSRASGVLSSSPQIWWYYYSTESSQSIFLEALYETPSFVVHSHTHDAPYSPSISTSRSTSINQIHSIVFLADAAIAVPPTRGTIQSTRPGVLCHDRSQPSHDHESTSA